MIKLYFKQAFHLLKENKLLSSISIIGTALAIAMIMVIVITLRAIIAPFAPESYRDRMLISGMRDFSIKQTRTGRVTDLFLIRQRKPVLKKWLPLKQLL